MKKAYIRNVALLSLVLSSCSQEEMPGIDSANDGNVSFNISLDTSTRSRTFGDGYSATTLNYAVYTVPQYSWDSPTLIESGSTSFDSHSLDASVSIDLSKGVTYDVIFFADNEANGVYTFNAGSNTADVTIDYSKMNTTEEQVIDFDCFYKVEHVTAGGSAACQNIVLTRPVAQINFGTDDLSATSVTDAFPDGVRTRFSAEAYTRLNLLTGEPCDKAKFTTIVAAKTIDAEYGQFAVEGFDYLYSIYLLAPEGTSEVTDCTLSFHNGDNGEVLFRTINNVPYTRNYCTNIYGSLLTSSTESVTKVKQSDTRL